MVDPWIIDTDAGVDDCQALVLALKSNMNVKAITTLCGNIMLPQVNKNVAEVLRVCDREDVPIYSGAERPFLQEPFFGTATVLHGEDGVNGYWSKHPDHAPDLKQPESEPAAIAITRMAKEYKDQLSIVTIGPLTNLGLALKLDPQLPSKIKRLVVMGCAVHGKGNITSTAEFNIWADPEAAFMVFKHFPMSEIISWELTVDPAHALSYDFLQQYTGQDNKTGHFVRDITKLLPQATGNASNCYFCDPFAVAYALDPSLALSSELREGTVELRGEHTRGMTVVNWAYSDVEFVNEQKPNMKIITSLDMEKVKSMLLNSVS